MNEGQKEKESPVHNTTSVGRCVAGRVKPEGGFSPFLKSAKIILKDKRERRDLTLYEYITNPETVRSRVAGSHKTVKN